MAERGRPPLFRKLYVDQSHKLASLGLTDEEMADFFNVSRRTFASWKKKYPDFLHTMKSGKAGADAAVAASLYERARGYEHEAVHFSMWEGEVIETPYTKRYPPDVQAIKMWLANRQPHLWKNKVEIKPEVTDPFPPVEILDEITRKAMIEIAARKESLRKERAGLNLDVESLLSGDLADE